MGGGGLLPSLNFILFKINIRYIKNSTYATDELVQYVLYLIIIQVYLHISARIPITSGAGVDVPTAAGTI